MKTSQGERTQDSETRRRTGVPGAFAVVRAAGIGLLIAAAAGQPARAADPACKVVIDAITKQVTTPTHTVVTDTSASHGGQPKTHESIYVDGVVYVQVKGQWMRSPMTAQKKRERQEETLHDLQSMSCRYLRDETVDGEAAAAYHVIQTQPEKSQATIWVSKRSGLPLRNENDIDPGDKDALHMVIRYDYANVRPPAGVK
jgi:outer membrane protein assembly factor BamB